MGNLALWSPPLSFSAASGRQRQTSRRPPLAGRLANGVEDGSGGFLGVLRLLGENRFDAQGRAQ